MSKAEKKYRVVENKKYGYRHLDPIPNQEELSDFYKNKYYDLIQNGGRAPEIRRLMRKDVEAVRERLWLSSTLYSDVCHNLKRYAIGKKILDVGCGTGDLILYLRNKKFNAIGVEPSIDAAFAAKKKGLAVYNCRLEDFLEKYGSKEKSFDAVTLMNILEHVTNPEQTIKLIKQNLRIGGVLCIKVPNDFSEIQLAAQRKLNKKPWWIAAPDHINYFNFSSLNKFLCRLGFKVVYSQADFPMELFLLLGYDYVGNPKIGGQCHRKRIDFEKSLSPELRRSLYGAMAGVGVGRDSLMFAKLVK